MIHIILAAALGVSIIVVLLFRRFAEIGRRQAEISQRQAEIARQLDETDRQLTEVHVDIARELLHLRHRFTDSRPPRPTPPGQAAAVGSDHHPGALPLVEQKPLHAKRHLRLYPGGLSAFLVLCGAALREALRPQYGSTVAALAGVAATVTATTVLVIAPWADSISQPPPSSAPTEVAIDTGTLSTTSPPPSSQAPSGSPPHSTSPPPTGTPEASGSPSPSAATSTTSPSPQPTASVVPVVDESTVQAEPSPTEAAPDSSTNGPSERSPEEPPAPANPSLTDAVAEEPASPLASALCDGTALAQALEAQACLPEAGVGG